MKKSILTIVLMGALLCPGIGAWAQTDANPNISFYGGTIVATPHYPIVGETAHIAVTVGNSGTEAASNVSVRIAFNDWGVTFNGWQEIGTVLIPSIPPGGSAVAEIEHVFVTRTHTCLEAVIVGADANTVIADDRGQINLEVINAGETFSYWVPVVNNGDEPLNLALAGRCVNRDGAAGGDLANCRQDLGVAHVEPGEEILVPIRLDLRGFAPGQELIFVVEAIDLGAGDPASAFNRNHVELRIVRQTARNLDRMALALLEATAAAVPDRGLRNRMDEVARHVRLALGARLWLDDNHLRNPGGAQVFAQAQAAVNQLMLLLADSGLPLAAKIALNEAALELTDAARILAETANAEASGGAQDQINEGDAERRLGKYSGAINSYKHAWQAAAP